MHKDFYRNTPFSATSFSDDFDIMSSSGIRARSVDAHSDGASSRQPSTIQKGTVRSGVDTPASLSSSSDSRESVSEGLRAHSHLHGENHAESVQNIDTSPHASLVTAADLATCLAENTVRSAGSAPITAKNGPNFGPQRELQGSGTIRCDTVRYRPIPSDTVRYRTT